MLDCAEGVVVSGCPPTRRGVGLGTCAADCCPVLEHGCGRGGSALLPKLGGSHGYAAGGRRRAHGVLHLAMPHSRDAQLGRGQALLAILHLERHVRAVSPPKPCNRFSCHVPQRSPPVASVQVERAGSGSVWLAIPCQDMVRRRQRRGNH
eukprot:COSAG02_NODE_2538_length_8577_cov_16.981835_5_plen_150_part_00